MTSLLKNILGAGKRTALSTATTLLQKNEFALAPAYTHKIEMGAVLKPSNDAPIFDFPISTPLIIKV